MESMRILMPTDVFPPFCGGSGWSTYYLAKALEKRGHEITIIVPKPDVKGVSFGKYNGLGIIYVGYKTSNIPLVKNYYKNEVFWKDTVVFLENYLAREQYDIIHAQHQMTIIPSIIVGNKLSIPVVSTIRDYWPICYFGTMFSTALNDCGLGCRDSGKMPFKSLAKIYTNRNVRTKQRVLKKCDRVIAVSNFVKKSISGVVDANRISVVPNIMDPVNGTRNESDYLLYVGSLSREKGILLLLDVLKRMKNAPRTLVAADGYLMEDVKRRVRDMGLNVELLGRVSHDKIISHMLSCKALVFPSTWHEPLSRTLIEASMFGVPIIATDTGGTSDIINDKKTGILVEPNAREFARKLENLTKDKKLRVRIGKGAQKNAKRKFRQRVIATKIENIYKKVLENA